MMNNVLEVPYLDDLRSMSIAIRQLDSPDLVEVTAWANDGAIVTVTWDEVACSVTVRCINAGDELIRLERESAIRVAIRDAQGQVEFCIWSEVENLSGQLVVRVGDHVRVSDALLRK